MSDQQQMNVTVMPELHHVEVQRRDIPVPDADQVIVQVAAVGVCGSDVHFFHEGRIGDMIVTGPLVLGHESGGTIVAVGSDVDITRIGERVSIEPQRVCRVCEMCTSGRYNLCPKIEFYAAPPIDGAFAEYVAIQAPFAHPVPDNVSDEAAALMEPLSVSIWSAQKAQISPGKRVLIAGAGPIGLVTAQVARAFGAAEVVVSDLVEARREQALRFGATKVVDPRDGIGEGYDAFIDASGAAPAVQSGIRALKPAGIAVLVGMGADEIPLPISVIQGRELIVTGVFRYANTWPTAIGLVASGQVDLDSLVTGRFGLEQVHDALESTTKPGTLKSIVVPSQLRI